MRTNSEIKQFIHELGFTILYPIKGKKHSIFDGKAVIAEEESLKCCYESLITKISNGKIVGEIWYNNQTEVVNFVKSNVREFRDNSFAFNSKTSNYEVVWFDKDTNQYYFNI